MYAARTGARLARHSDPRGVNLRWSPAPMQAATAPGEIEALITEAASHNVVPALARNLAIAAREEPEALVAGKSADAKAAVERLLTRVRETHLGLVGRNMILAGIASELLEAAGRAGLPVVLVKGLDFAETCYGGLAQRAFSDIDFLVRPDAAEPFARIVEAQGFATVEPTAKRETYTERQFTRADGRGNHLLVELHTDLAHAPKMRKRMSLTYDAYAGETQGGVTMAARLLLACVHGATSHLFDRLQYLVDIAMVARQGVDAAELSERTRQAGAGLCVAAGLDLAARVYDCPACMELAQALPPARYRKLARHLLTPATVLSAQGPARGRHSWRRQAFRVLLTR